jgi:hypothetical protein
MRSVLIAAADGTCLGRMAASSRQRPDLALVLVRIGVGALLLWEAQQIRSRGVGPWLIEDHAYRISSLPWYGETVGRIVLRLPELFAWLVFGGVAAAGASYFVGALVRPASLGLALLMANVAVAGPASRQEYAALLALCAAACYVGDAGRRLGLDAWLPAALTWPARAAAAKR